MEQILRQKMIDTQNQLIELLDKKKENKKQTPLEQISSNARRHELTSIQKSPFQKFVKEIVMNLPDFDNTDQIRFKADAVMALHYIAEEWLVGMFEDSLLCAMHAKRKTVDIRDMRLVERLRRLYM